MIDIHISHFQFRQKYVVVLSSLTWEKQIITLQFLNVTFPQIVGKPKLKNNCYYKVIKLSLVNCFKQNSNRNFETKNCEV